ncbi:MAG: YicC/YloC family endoribonuclease [Thermoanaerobaculia bacterium]
MTGFGRARGPVGPDWAAELVVRAVNHRFLDLSIKLRETEASLEPLLRKVFSRRVARGKVEVSLKLRRVTPARAEVTVDEGLLEALLARITALSEKYPVRGALEARDLLTIPQILSVEVPIDGFSETELASLEALAEDAARELGEMRRTEGRVIAADLLERLGFLRGKLDDLEARREEITGKVRDTLRARIEALLPGVALESGRIEQEAALAADRSDVTEELSRLSGHIAQFHDLVTRSSEPVGKRLDFLAQEILRELNTLGAKARDLQLIREVLEMKSEIEKVREQVQNVE